jgi:hypothetical protein
MLNNPVLSQQITANGVHYKKHQQQPPNQFSNSRDLETASQAASSAYVGRSKLNRNKSAATSQRGSVVGANIGTGAKRVSADKAPSSGMKVYIPTDYYKHTGYIARDVAAKSSTTKSQVGGGHHPQGNSDP